jgi:hypothetical protein
MRPPVLGSARVSRVGDSILSSRTFLFAAYRDNHSDESSFRRDAETNTRDACAPQTHRGIASACQRWPQNLKRAQVYFARLFEIDCRQFRMVHCRGETLLAARVSRRRKRPADVPAHDARAASAQLRQRPNHVIEREPAALPVCDGFPGPNAIEIDGDVDWRSAQRLDELGEFCAPVRSKDRSAPVLLRNRPVVRPWMDLEFATSLRAPVPKELPRPPAFEIPATPDTDLLDGWKFQGAIHPATATPARRAQVPIRMIIERDEHERLGDPANPERAEVMKIPRPVDKKFGQPAGVLAKKILDQTCRRGETQTRPPLPRIHRRQIGRQIGPGVVEVEVQTSKSLCAQFTGRKRT